MASGSTESPRSIVVALASDVAIAVTKAVVAVVTGSAAMTSEAIHSFVDSLNEVLLLVGRKRSLRPPDREHPLGYGRELYFWTLIVSLLIFTLGGGMSVYEGVTHLVRPHASERSAWTWVVLAVAAAGEAWATIVAYREYRASRAQGLGFWRAFVASKDLTTWAVLFENAAALLGVAVAALGIVASRVTGSPVPDALASIAIGLLLLVVALLLTRESKGLLIGESTSPAVAERIRALAGAHPDVARVLSVLTVQTGPYDVFLGLEIEFRDGLTTRELVRTVDEVERSVREAFPDVTRIYVEADRLVQSERVAARA